MSKTVCEQVGLGFDSCEEQTRFFNDPWKSRNQKRWWKNHDQFTLYSSRENLVKQTKLDRSSVCRCVYCVYITLISQAEHRRKVVGILHDWRWVIQEVFSRLTRNIRYWAHILLRTKKRVFISRNSIHCCPSLVTATTSDCITWWKFMGLLLRDQLQKGEANFCVNNKFVAQFISYPIFHIMQIMILMF